MSKRSPWTRAAGCLTLAVVLAALGAVLLPGLLHLGILFVAFSQFGGGAGDGLPATTPARPWGWQDVQTLLQVLPWAVGIGVVGVVAGLYRSARSRRRGAELEEQLHREVALARFRLLVRREQAQAQPGSPPPAK